MMLLEGSVLSINLGGERSTCSTSGMACAQAGGLAESLQEKMHPLFEHVHDAVDGAYDFVAAYSVQGLQAASMIQQTISARIHHLIAP